MKKRNIVLLTVILLLGSQFVTAQQSKRLNKGWQYLKGDLGGIWEAVRPFKKGDPESVPVWAPVVLPHCFNATDAVDPDVNYYQGPGWYKTTLKVDNPYKNGRTLLHFEGAGQKTQVYIYTNKVGEHVGGYDEWTLDITDAVADFKKNKAFQEQFKGEIPVSIRCDNSRDLEMIPSDLSDFNIYGGIYRYLNLVYQPAISFDKVFASVDVDAAGKMGNLSISARFYNPSQITQATVKFTLKEPSGKVVKSWEQQQNYFSGDQKLWNVIIRKPVLWSPDEPNLYTLVSTVTQNGSSSTQTDKIAFRNFEFVKKGPFMLNGKRLLIRGTHRHEDHAGVGAAMTEEMIKQEMQLIKDMGVNFIRLAHYQQSHIVLNQCDSLGILVWEEIPWCRGGLGGDIYQAQAKRMLTNMIEQHHNHPSVIIWGLGNENDWPNDFPEFDEERIRNFMKQLNSLAHQLDSSRKTAIRRCDFCKDIVDVYSPSIWAGWYRGVYTDYKTASKEEFDKVDRFIHMEWGGDSDARRHSENPDKVLQKVNSSSTADERAGDASLYGGPARISKDGDWSESYICNLFDWHLKEQETMPWLSGTAEWVFKDFSTPVRPENPVPYVNQKGVIERDFTKKEAYYVFQSYWTTKPMVHIYGHSWPVRWGDEGEKKMLKVYSNCDEAEMFVNGKSYGVRKRNSQDFPAAGLRWNAPLNAGKNEVRVVATKGKITVQDSINFEYETRKWGKPAKLEVKKAGEENGIATVEVKLFDAKGVQCLDARNVLRFSLSGDGRLIDDQGTSSGSRVLELYNGRAIIKVDIRKGNSIVGAGADGIKSVFINL